MTEGSFTSNVPKDVIQQIQVRERRFGCSNGTYTPEELEVVHGNTVWCLLRSGVNTPVNDADRFKILETGEHVECNNRCALGGMLGGELINVDKSLRAGVALKEPAGKAYRIDTLQGHRPIPGITGFTVRSKDTWGMILEADISIKVWSRDDLEDMDRIYFKPGYTALFEWGHTLYFTQDDKICKTPSLMIDDSFFFREGDGHSFDELDKAVYEARRKDCNREACFGYITNFSYKFNHDGSYDCSLKILSKGSVNEGLTIPVKGKGQEETTNAQDSVNWWEQSAYHAILKAFDSYNKAPASSSAQFSAASSTSDDEDPLKLPGFNGTLPVLSSKAAFSSPEGKKYISETVETLVSDFPVIGIKLAKEKKKFLWFGKNQDAVWNYYIPLRCLLHLLNQVSGTRYSLTSTLKLGQPDAIRISLDPLVAVFPNQSEKYWVVDGNPFQTATDAQPEDYKDPRQILNLWVSFSMFVDRISAHINGDIDKVKVDAVVREFLGLIQKSLGNINDLGIVSNHVYGDYQEVVDFASIRVENDQIPEELGISGLRNTVIELSAESDVSPDMANEMSIAATAPGLNDDGSENSDQCLVFWGENCKNRWIEPPVENRDTGTTPPDSKKPEDVFEKLKELYKSIRNMTIGGDGGTVADICNDLSDLFNNIRALGERQYLEQNRLALSKKENLMMGVIPVKLGLTMLGISRLTIGNTFRIRNSVFPRKYSNWGFIITGIEHKIVNNQWFTHLTTQYYPVYPDETFTRTFTRVGTTDGLESPTSYVSPSTLYQPLPHVAGSVRIAQASGTHGHTAQGDLSGKEVKEQDVSLDYIRKNFEFVGRSPDAGDGARVAALAVRLANYNNVGFSMGENRIQLYNALVKKYHGNVEAFIASGKMADVDCSGLAHTCYAAVNFDKYKIENNGNWLTSTAVAYDFYKKRGWTIRRLSEITSPSELKPGDVIWRRAGYGGNTWGHTIIVVKGN